MALPPFPEPSRKPRRIGAALIVAFLVALAGCGAPTPPPTAEGGPAVANYNVDYVPDFARKPYEPFARHEAVAIALREWRLFGQNVDDDPPDTRPEPPADLKPERMAGLWQRVGEYWWLGLNPTATARYWTGKHDAFGVQFPANVDGDYAWSAAFISYVMRIAGAGERFPYSQSHSSYINAARRISLGGSQGWIVSAERPDTYAPQLGDLICTGRGETKKIRYESLPRGGFASHCDIVVQVAPGELSVLGGNVDDAVTMKHVPVTDGGLLATPGGGVLDYRYQWFVVLRVMYDAN